MISFAQHSLKMLWSLDYTSSRRYSILKHTVGWVNEHLSSLSIWIKHTITFKKTKIFVIVTRQQYLQSAKNTLNICSHPCSVCLQKLEMQFFRGHLLKIKNNGDHPHFNVSYYAFSAKLNFFSSFCIWLWRKSLKFIVVPAILAIYSVYAIQ